MPESLMPTVPRVSWRPMVEWTSMHPLTTNYNLFGRGRMARNVDPSTLRCLKDADFIEKGIHNWLLQRCRGERRGAHAHRGHPD